MSSLLSAQPFVARDDDLLLAELIELSKWHLNGCPNYRRVWPNWAGAKSFDALPYLHVGAFKHTLFQTQHAETQHQRILTSSSTSGAAPSQIALDAHSSELQSNSSLAILTDLVGSSTRPLLILDDSRSLRRRGELSARSAAALSLRPLATEIHFLLGDAGAAESLDWDRLRCVLNAHDELLVYGFTWILWQAWGGAAIPQDIREALRGKRVHFVHSGGWKKLEALRVDRQMFDDALLNGLDPTSRVVDYYGLVEQVGVLFPLCEYGFRHAPRWAQVIVRDAWTLDPLSESVGLLQMMNPLAWGAPYHSVLTEDLGRIVPGDCNCGRQGVRFELLGRIPHAELRGCANV